MENLVHKISGALALATILVFWVSTVVSELLLGFSEVVLVKTSIPYGFLVLIPALALAGVSGKRLAPKVSGGMIDRKQKRMQFAAANGLLVLVPAALYLAFKAQAGAFDASFYVVQGLELAAGFINITLLGLNMRDGLRIAANRKLVQKSHRSEQV